MPQTVIGVLLRIGRSGDGVVGLGVLEGGK
jgi:hypothetical protein